MQNQNFEHTSAERALLVSLYIYSVFAHTAMEMTVSETYAQMQSEAYQKKS